MVEPPAPEQTASLLRRMAAGDAGAADDLLPRVYAELHGIAHRLMRRERAGHTLQTTALINEAWLRLARERVPSETRGHFLKIAAQAMRRILVDNARARKALKRQRDRAVPLEDDALAFWDAGHADLLDLDRALTRLGARDDQLQRIVELRFFAGLTLEETGAVLGLSVRQVHLGWTFARGWLKRQLRLGLTGGD